jgi:protoporphyrinogen oxidase
VDVYERWPGLGGQAATIDVGGGHRIERYYHVVLSTDRHLIGLYAALGMADQLEWFASSLAMFADGRLHPFTSPADLLRYRPLSLRSRVRLGAAVLNLQKRHREVEPFEGITARYWVERHMGREVYAKVWGPLLRGKFADKADEISMSWLWGKLMLRRELKGSEARQEVFGYGRGGWEPLFVEMARRIEEGGGRVLIDRPAARLAREPGGNGYLVTPAAPDSFRRGLDPRAFDPGGPPERYDAVIVTVPNDVFLELCDEQLVADLGPEYVRRLRACEYYATVCLVLELDRQFTPYFWTNVIDKLPFVGLVELTNFVEPERYDGRRFLYVANYLPRHHQFLSLNLQELLTVYDPGMRAINRDWSPEWIQGAWMFREPAAQPVVPIDYRGQMPGVDTGVPRLALCNTTQVFPADRGTNYAIPLAEQAVEVISR